MILIIRTSVFRQTPPLIIIRGIFYDFFYDFNNKKFEIIFVIKTSRNSSGYR